MEHYGFVAIIPPLLAIGMSIITRNVMISLISGVLFGTTVLAGWNPIIGFIDLIPKYVYKQAGDNIQSLINLLIIGAFVSLIGATGGARAFANIAAKVIHSKRSTEFSMWLGGLFVWFSDSANSLIVGPIFQPIGDKFKVSREKFAYILDATSSPICALVPIISWGVYIMGLIQAELDAFPSYQVSSWEVFMGAVPFQFYSILTLIMVGYVCYTQFDYGPMLEAQKRALSGKVLRDGAVPLRNTKEEEMESGKEPKAITVILPLLVLLVVMFGVFIANGFPKVSLKGVVIRQGIALGFICGGIACATLSLYYKMITLKKVETAVFNGMKDMVYLFVLMVFAWSLGSVCKQLGTAYYIMDATKSFLNPAFLPAILFIVGAVMSLATGSSWGPYAILMPIGLPIAIAMGAPVFVTVAAIISGGLFGDHCSPLSDTTLLASMGAACDHMDHFKTQFPYAVTVAGVSVVLYVVAGLTSSPMVVLPGMLALFALIYALHKLSIRKYALSEKS